MAIINICTLYSVKYLCLRSFVRLCSSKYMMLILEFSRLTVKTILTQVVILFLMQHTIEMAVWIRSGQQVLKPLRFRS